MWALDKRFLSVNDAIFVYQQCSTLRSKVSELEGELVIQRQQQQDNEEGVRK